MKIISLILCFLALSQSLLAMDPPPRQESSSSEFIGILKPLFCEGPFSKGYSFGQKRPKVVILIIGSGS